MLYDIALGAAAEEGALVQSMKVKKLEQFWNKIGLKGCKWSSLNAPGTETLSLIQIGKGEILPTPIISPLG